MRPVAASVAFSVLGLCGCAAGWQPTSEPTLLQDVVDGQGEDPWPAAIRLVPEDAEITRGFVVADFDGYDGLRPFVVRPIEHQLGKAVEECDGGRVRLFVTASAGQDRSLTVVVADGLALSRDAAQCFVAKASELTDAHVRVAGPTRVVLVSEPWRDAVQSRIENVQPAALSAPVPGWSSLWMVLAPPQVDTSGPFAHVDGARALLDLRTLPRFELELHAAPGKSKSVYKTWKRTPLSRSLVVGIPSRTFVDHELARRGEFVTLVGRGVR